MLHIIEHSVLDSLKLVPFLFLTYLVMEYLEHKAGDKTQKVIGKAGKYGPLLGGVLGVAPQCGFSTAASNLYAGRVISMGTLLAVYLSTSDEMLPILISAKAEPALIVKILVLKVLIGMAAGFLVDFCLPENRKSIIISMKCAKNRIATVRREYCVPQSIIRSELRSLYS